MFKVSSDTDEVRGLSIVQLEGRVDSDTAPQLEEALAGLLEANCNKIVINLQAVEFLSSAGLRAIVRAYQAAQKAGGSVRLAAVPQSIEVILHTVGFDKMFSLYPTDQEAIAEF